VSGLTAPASSGSRCKRLHRVDLRLTACGRSAANGLGLLVQHWTSRSCLTSGKSNPIQACGSGHHPSDALAASAEAYTSWGGG